MKTTTNYLTRAQTHLEPALPRGLAEIHKRAVAGAGHARLHRAAVLLDLGLLRERGPGHDFSMKNRLDVS